MDNQQLFFLIYSFSHQNSLLDQLMIFGANFLIYFAALWVLVGFLKGVKTEKQTLPLIIIGEVLAFCSIWIIQNIYPTNRPFVDLNLIPLIPIPASSASFPSIHTTFLSVIAFTYLFLKAKVARLMVLLLILTGFARIYVGVHYPLDILGGIIIGFISVMIVQLVKQGSRQL